MLDFIQFIDDNANLSAVKKISLLEDFVAQYDYQEELEDGTPNPVTKKEFANKQINQYIIQSVQAARFTRSRAAVEIEELELEPVP